MQMLSTASKLDWGGWLLGIMGAVISGGSAAISSFAAVTFVDGQDPDKFIAKGSHMFEVAAITFGVSAIVSLAKYLQTHPVPDKEPQVNP